VAVVVLAQRVNVARETDWLAVVKKNTLPALGTSQLVYFQLLGLLDVEDV